MKKLLILTFLVIPFFVNAQWKLLYKTNSYNAYNLLEVSGNNVFVVDSDSALVKKSLDGGNTWSIHTTEMSNNWFGDWFLDIDFPSTNVGYVCGGTAFGRHQSSLIKTTDGGVTWDSITSNIYGYNFTDLHFLNEDTGLISQNYGLLLTKDGGETFSEITMPTLTRVMDVYSSENNVIYISTSKNTGGGNTFEFKILRSTNFGSNWTEVYTDLMSNVTGLSDRMIHEIFFIDDDNGFAVGGNGTFLKTVDGGLTWQSSTIIATSSLSSVYFINKDIGYINLEGGVFKTIDGGDIWEEQTIDIPSKIGRIIFANDSVGYAIGDSGVYKIVEKSNINNLETYLVNGFSIFPNPSNGLFQIQNELMIDKVEVFDIHGKKINEISNSKLIDINNQPAGVYIIQIKSGKKIVRKKVVKN